MLSISNLMRSKSSTMKECLPMKFQIIFITRTPLELGRLQTIFFAGAMQVLGVKVGEPSLKCMKINKNLRQTHQTTFGLENKTFIVLNIDKNQCNNHRKTVNTENEMSCPGENIWKQQRRKSIEPKKIPFYVKWNQVAHCPTLVWSCLPQATGNVSYDLASGLLCNVQWV